MIMDNQFTNDLVVFADGGSRNSGAAIKGGSVAADDLSAWGYLIIDYQNNQKKYDARAYLGKTNNAMEIAGVLKAFQQLIDNQDFNQRPFDLVLDSKYVLDSLQKGWLNNWIKKNQVERPNFELWQELYPLFKQLEPQITYKWVKGHNQSEGNIFVDQLLNQAMDSKKANSD